MTCFDPKIKSIEDMYDVIILPAKINGSRWAFEGHFDKKIPVSASKKIQFTDNSGFVVYKWDDLDEKTRNDLEKKLMELGAEKR